MFSMLVTCYLFLGGAGAGALVVLSMLECANARRRWAGFPIVPTRVERALVFPDEFFARAWPACFVILAVGLVCLVADLGRPDRLLVAFASPSPTALSIGTYALAASLACACGFALFELLDGLRGSPAAIFAAGAASAVAGLVAMVYTGVLLQSLASVLFWQTPLLPVLFVLSSLSCGIACVFAAAAFVETRRPFTRPLVRLAHADGTLIVIEVVCLAAYVLVAMTSDGTMLAAQAFVNGDLSGLFWLGLMVCGLGVPFVLECFLTHGNSRVQLLWIAGCLLAGGFVLRMLFVGASAYDITQMPSVLFGLAPVW